VQCTLTNQTFRRVLGKSVTQCSAISVRWQFLGIPCFPGAPTWQVVSGTIATLDTSLAKVDRAGVDRLVLPVQ